MGARLSTTQLCVKKRECTFITQTRNTSDSFGSTEVTTIDEVVLASIAAIMRKATSTSLQSDNFMFTDSDGSLLPGNDSDILSLRWRLIEAMQTDDEQGLSDMLPLLRKTTIGQLMSDTSQLPNSFYSAATCDTLDEFTYLGDFVDDVGYVGATGYTDGVNYLDASDTAGLAVRNKVASGVIIDVGAVHTDTEPITGTFSITRMTKPEDTGIVGIRDNGNTSNERNKADQMLDADKAGDLGLFGDSRIARSRASANVALGCNDNTTQSKADQMLEAEKSLNEIINKKIKTKGLSLPCTFIAVSFAAIIGATRCIGVLLNQWEEHMNPGNGMDTMAVHFAAKKGHIGVINRLLKSKHIDPTFKNNKTLFNATYNGHADVVMRLLEDKRVDPRRARDAAFYSGNLEVAKVVLQCERVDMSEVGEDALISAADSGATEIVKLLLNDKRINPINDPSLLLSIACRVGNTSEVKRLLDVTDINPADIDRLFDSPSSNGHHKVVKLLLKDGRADPGNSIEHAVRFGHLKVVKLLLQDIRVNTENLRYEIERSIQEGHASPKFIKYMMGTEWMPGISRVLELACKQGNLNLVKFIFQNVAEGIAIDWDYRNKVIWAACDRGHIEIVKLLLQDPKRTVSANPDFCFSIACRVGDVKQVKQMLRRDHFALYTRHTRNRKRNGTHNSNILSSTTYTAMRWGKPVTGQKKKPSIKANTSYGRLIKRPPMYTTEHALVTACANGHLSVVKILLKEGHTDPTSYQNSPLKTALFARRPDICEVLLGDIRVIETVDYMSVLVQAVVHSMVGVVRVLLGGPLTSNLGSSVGGPLQGVLDPTEFEPNLLETACIQVNADLVRLLLDDGRVDPSGCLEIISQKLKDDGVCDILTLILGWLLHDSRVDPVGSSVFVNACRYNRVATARLLIEDGRVKVNGEARRAAKKGKGKEIATFLRNL